MNSRDTISMALRGTLVLLVALAVGCASTTGTDRAASASGSLDALVGALKDVDSGVDQTLKALDVLVSAPGDDLKGQFDAYSKSVTALEGKAKTVSDRAGDVKGRGEEYFKGWEASSGTLSSEEAREVSEKRRAELGNAYGDVKDRALKLSEDFQPFLKALKDVEGYLKLDLTSEGLQSVSDTVKKVRTDGAAVKETIAGLIPDLEKVQKLLSPTAGT